MSQRLDSSTSAAPGRCTAGVFGCVALALVLAFGVCLHAQAQSAPVVQQGTTFANRVAPTSASQIVNPAAVNPAAWGPSAATPSAVLPNLGGFSQPVTSKAAYAAAKTGGLTPLGTQAMVNCSNFVPGPNPDPLQVQACAAVNFMTNNCMTPSTQQASVIAHLGAGQTVGGNCVGTYGAGVQSFNMASQVTPADSIFTVVNALKTTAPAAFSGQCTTQTVVTTPTQYATYTCTKNTDTSVENCSQYVNVAVTTTVTPAVELDSCASGVLVGKFCDSTTTSPATVTYSCAPGTTLSGTSCTATSTDPATPIYSCPAGQAQSGTTCVATATSSATAAADCSLAQQNELSPGLDPAFGYPYAGNTSTTPTPAFLVTLAGPDKCWLRLAANFSNWVAAGGAATIVFPKGVSWEAYPAPTLYTCPAGATLSGSSCITTSTTAGSITGYFCPTGTLSGTNCVTSSVASATPTYVCAAGAALSGTTCTSTTTAPATATYSCADGSAPIAGSCFLHSVAESWTDTCGPYEASAGAVLPLP